MKPDRLEEILEKIRLFGVSPHLVKDLSDEIDSLLLQNSNFEDDIEALTEKVDIYERQGRRNDLEYSAKLEREIVYLNGDVDRLKKENTKLREYADKLEFEVHQVRLSKSWPPKHK